MIGRAVTDYPIDWSRVVLELRGSGWTYQRIQDALSAPDGMCDRLVRGGEPRFRPGLALLMLHRQETRRDPPMLWELSA